MIKYIFNLCLLLFCLILNSNADKQKSNKELKTVIDVLEDLQAAAGGHYGGGGDEYMSSGYTQKSGGGGSNSGGKKYDNDKWNKYGSDWGKKSNNEYDKDSKWGNSKWNKDALDQKAAKWGDSKGGKKDAKFNEWADNAKWKSDKGKGYEKSYEYDKSDGAKNSYGKSAKNNDDYYKSSHGSKHDLNKYNSDGKQDYGKKETKGKSDFSDWGKKYGNDGKSDHGKSYWSEKKPTYHKSSKYDTEKKSEQKNSGHDSYGGGKGGDEYGGEDSYGGEEEYGKDGHEIEYDSGHGGYEAESGHNPQHGYEVAYEDGGVLGHGQDWYR